MAGAWDAFSAEASEQPEEHEHVWDSFDAPVIADCPRGRNRGGRRAGAGRGGRGRGGRGQGECPRGPDSPPERPSTADTGPTVAAAAAPPVPQPTKNWKAFVVAESSAGAKEVSCILRNPDLESSRSNVVAKAVNHTLNMTRRRMCLSTVAETEILGFKNRAHVRRTLTACGAMIFIVACCCWKSQVAWLAREESLGHLSVKVVMASLSSDETTVNAGQKMYVDLLGAEVAAQQPPKKKARQLHILCMAVKILQSELILSFTVQWPDSANLSVILCEVPVKLQSADRMTGRSCYHLWRDTVDWVWDAIQIFKSAYKVSLSMADRGSCNGKANRSCRSHTAQNKTT